LPEGESPPSSPTREGRHDAWAPKEREKRREVFSGSAVMKGRKLPALLSYRREGGGLYVFGLGGRRKTWSR